MNASFTRSHAPRFSSDCLQAEVTATDWECALADTRYLTHDIHRYSSKYIPQIARQAIELLTRPGDLVLDPMVGSGTTLLEAWLTSRKALGLDLNPLAVLITRAKIQRVPPRALDKAVELLLGVAACLAASGEGQPSHTITPAFELADEAAIADPRRQDPWFVKWFQAQVLSDLLVLDAAIHLVDDQRARDLACVALSEVLRRSSNAHSGFPNVMFDRKAPPKPRPAPAFVRALTTYADLARKLDSVDGSEPHVDLRDARHTELQSASVDAIVSHPPYIGSVPYAEYGLVSLKWLGVDSRALDRELLGGRRQSRDVIDRFQASYAAVLGEAHRVLRPGRGMFLMVGDPVVRGDLVDLARMTRETASAVGFVQIAETTRLGTNRRANKMAHETLMFFEKPS